MYMQRSLSRLSGLPGNRLLPSANGHDWPGCLSFAVDQSTLIDLYIRCTNAQLAKNPIVPVMITLGQRRSGRSYVDANPHLPVRIKTKNPINAE